MVAGGVTGIIEWLMFKTNNQQPACWLFAFTYKILSQFVRGI